MADGNGPFHFGERFLQLNGTYLPQTFNKQGYLQIIGHTLSTIIQFSTMDKVNTQSSAFLFLVSARLASIEFYK